MYRYIFLFLIGSFCLNGHAETIEHRWWEVNGMKRDPIDLRSVSSIS